MEFNFKKQHINALKATHPDLYSIVTRNFPDSSEEEQGKIAGLCIEYVIQSRGEIEIFQDDILDDTIYDEDDEDFLTV